MSDSNSPRVFGRPLPPREPISTLPDWKGADPDWIDDALQRALALPASGWYAVDAARNLGDEPRLYRLLGRDYVAWRHDGRVFAGPDACPHMGASLSEGRVGRSGVVCPWHGLCIGERGHGEWQAVPAFDDGVLLWLAPSGTRPRDEGPILAERPVRFLDAVMVKQATCEVEDVIANRLDPWHGAHFHPYSFGRLSVLEQLDDEITVRVVYRVVGNYGVEVDARFHCPDPATIVMTIVEGEGKGSVVETHATPVDRERTAIIESTLATSDRPQFWAVVSPLSGLLRPLVRKAADRLWVDDAAYAERRFALRTGRAG